jgi:prephenate dehydrogenase
MFTCTIKNNVTIIGAGLVGGAVLRELARGWARTVKEQTTTQQDAQLRYSEIKTISFTARS